MKQLVMWVCLVLIFSSCTKENSDSFFPYPNSPFPDTTWTAQPVPGNEASLLMAELRTPAMNAQVNISAGGIVLFAGGIQLQFPAQSLWLLNGTPFTGNAQIELLPVLTKGNMIRNEISTHSSNAIFESAGAFYIKATGNGQQLNLAPNRLLKIKYPSTVINQLLGVFFADTTQGSYHWYPAQDSSFVLPYQQVDSLGVTRGYEIYTTHLHWTNSGHFVDTLQTSRTRFDVLLPINFTNNNCKAFAVFKNENVVIQLQPNFGTRSFYALNIPVGKQVTLLAMARNGNNYYLHKKDITISANDPVSLQPTVVTKAQLEQVLDGL